jgi:hypothetical protein
VTLSKHEVARISSSLVYGTGRLLQYSISGLPSGEHALIAEFPDHGWRILRWNDEWHGNWTGNHATADEAVEALREEVQAVA